MPLLKNKLAGVMIKTVSEACNLSCDYCYYSRCQGKPGKVKTIDLTVLERFIQEYFDVNQMYAPFVWQGGEPLLAGLDFFETVVKLQQKYKRERQVVQNMIQTNGTLITKRWAEFFKQHNFLVGVSLDGPKHLHDKRRVTANGQGSFDAVMRGIEELKACDVPFNILTVLHETNITSPKDMYAFIKEQNFTHVQFLPCMDFMSQHPDNLPRYHISDMEYGKFMSDIFDEWYNAGQPEVSIRFFENTLAAHMNQKQEFCQLNQSCPKMLVLEQNGNAYPCDFYIHPDYKLGNISEDRLEDIINHDIWARFSTMKKNLPNQCQSCDFLKYCHGGCPRNRGSQHLQTTDYFCEGYKRIFRHSHERLEFLAEQLRKGDYQPSI